MVSRVAGNGKVVLPAAGNGKVVLLAAGNGRVVPLAAGDEKVVLPAAGDGDEDWGVGCEGWWEETECNSVSVS